ncbi:VQ motif-containing protein [Striga hermonthica]|uniref:VQ motif-containing protein n=1 Tax=Striga hermonthica TaxID=68872 RepID=A0A9N7RTS1_STRHE|nr:VQ motif-containing protein [Striga hermonthica]
MDSRNSGSPQSSSGGEEEYDSRAAGGSISAFMSGGGGPISNPPPPPLFDPFSNYLHLHQNSNPSPPLGPNPDWARITSIKPDPTNPPNARDGANLLPGSSTITPPPPDPNRPAARNPKKRTRASRRAPTTVLTTDTTNFRAMVQEFTGIPALPFDGGPCPGPSFTRARTDLFGPSRSAASFAQKSHPPPLPFLAATNSVVTSSTAAGASTSNPTVFQNPFLANLLQPNPKFPFPDHPPAQFTLAGQHGHGFLSSDDRNNSGKDKEESEEHSLNLRPLNGGFDFLDGGGGKRPESNSAAGEEKLKLEVNSPSIKTYGQKTPIASQSVTKEPATSNRKNTGGEGLGIRTSFSSQQQHQSSGTIEEGRRSNATTGRRRTAVEEGDAI